MKRIFAFLTVLGLVLTLFGCKQQKEEPFEVFGAQTQSPGTEQVPEEETKEQPTESTESTSEEEEATLVTEKETVSTESSEKMPTGTGLVFVEPENKEITFEFEDCAGLPLVSVAEYPKGPGPYVVYDDKKTSYETVMDSIGEDGLIVVGSAFGEREGLMNPYYMPFTKTQFKIEKVLYGTAPGDTVTVTEYYFPDFTTENSREAPCICYGTRFYSFLKNNNRVLLFLKKNTIDYLEKGTEKEHLYAQAYYSLPVPKNYTEYSEEGLNSLLDYYRGEETAYKKGYAKRWPQGTRSNDEVLEEQTDNVLVQLAVNQKILIWPDGHANFEGCSFPYQVRRGLREWSNPE